MSEILKGVTGTDCTEIELRPGVRTVVVAVLFILTMLLCLAYWATHTERYSNYGNILLPVCGIFLLSIGIDALQRRVVISLKAASVRYLFLWRTYNLKVTVL